MQVALEVLPQIEDEVSFAEAREELANALPQIAAASSASIARPRRGEPGDAAEEDRGSHGAG